MIEVSFIVIAYNEGKSIDRCLKSIEQLDHISNAEIIVVDDGSKDKTYEIIRKHAQTDKRIRAVRLLRNQGRGAARAAGVKASSGKYIAFIDADIVLPPNWYTTCLSYMDSYDAVGGIATPDADVNFVYTTFNLSPKLISHTITITGNNGLYRRELFEEFNFDARLRDGEDVVFVHAIEKNHKKTLSIQSLVVEHRETKSFLSSVRWLYEMGKGATRQLKQLRKIRFPDIAAMGFVIFIVMGILGCCVTGFLLPFLLPLAYVVTTAAVHMYTRFHMRLHDIWKYPFAIGVQSILITAYYVGRCVGVFTTKVPKTRTKLMVCFDYEGTYGMPHIEKYNISHATHTILDVLDTYGVSAVFFVVGKLVEERPDLIRLLAERGHCIAIHGYTHEHLDTYSDLELQALSKHLKEIRSSVSAITGVYPTGFRSPFLMAPAFHTPQLYKTLKENGFTWISNRSIRHEREFLEPKELYVAPFLMRSRLIRKCLFILLNWRFIMTDSVSGSRRFTPITNMQWLLGDMRPFKRHGLIEVPAHAPLDWELLKDTLPTKETPPEYIQYATLSLTQNCRDARESYNVTFHDWIIGSNNRLTILENILRELSCDKDIEFVLPQTLLSQYE